MKDHWKAFRTIHYFLTGRQGNWINTPAPLYKWYQKIEDRAYERSIK